MWTVIYIAMNRAQAEILKDKLSKEGILAQIRPVGVATVGDGMHEVMVLKSEAADAQIVLCEYVAR